MSFSVLQQRKGLLPNSFSGQMVSPGPPEEIPVGNSRVNSELLVRAFITLSGESKNENPICGSTSWWPKLPKRIFWNFLSVLYQILDATHQNRNFQFLGGHSKRFWTPSHHLQSSLSLVLDAGPKPNFGRTLSRVRTIKYENLKKIKEYVSKMFKIEHLNIEHFEQKLFKLVHLLFFLILIWTRTYWKKIPVL